MTQWVMNGKDFTLLGGEKPRLPITKELPPSLTSFAPGSTAQERRAGNS